MTFGSGPSLSAGASFVITATISSPEVEQLCQRQRFCGLNRNALAVDIDIVGFWVDFDVRHCVVMDHVTLGKSARAAHWHQRLMGAKRAGKARIESCLRHERITQPRGIGAKRAVLRTIFERLT